MILPVKSQLSKLTRISVCQALVLRKCSAALTATGNVMARHGNMTAQMRGTSYRLPSHIPDKLWVLSTSSPVHPISPSLHANLAMVDGGSQPPRPRLKSSFPLCHRAIGKPGGRIRRTPGATPTPQRRRTATSARRPARATRAAVAADGDTEAAGEATGAAVEGVA
jgi:hypothetical protein